MSKRKFKYRRVILLILMIGAITSLIALSKNVAKLVSLKREHAQAMAEKERIEALNEDLLNEIKNLDNPEYVIRVARAEYRFTLPGEHVVIFPEE